MKYIANFDDEYFGKWYKAGETLKLGKDDDEEQLKGPVTDGRLTKIDDDDPVVPALGATGTTTEQPDALDHDGDGRKGGSKAGDEATARKK
jgi:hypothetical protein